MPCRSLRDVLLGLLGLTVSLPALAGGESTGHPAAPERAPLAAVDPEPPSPDLRQQLRRIVNHNTVELITSGVSGTHARIADDLAQALNDDKLRVLPVVGRETLDNITDLLYLRGIDMAVVQLDDLEYARRQKDFFELREHVHYVTKLFNEEVHLLADEAVRSLADLAGRRVNLGPPEGATAITLQAVLDTLGVPVQATYLNHEEALARLRAGDIAAMAFVTGKPAPLFEALPADTDLHFVPVDYDAGLLDVYLPARLTSADYPQLVAADAAVSTVAVGTVLVAYRWPVENRRSQELARFVARLFDRIDSLREAPFHPKWREVSLSAVLPGWRRHPAASQWLGRADR